MSADKEMHFLVVDDTQESRETVVEYLRTLGYEKISEATDGAEGLRILERDSSINFVISDWDMPTLNGLGLLQKVRSSPIRSNLPFLIMTSPVSAEAEKIMMAAENYVDAYVIKPFRSSILQEKIEKMLETSVHGPKKQAVLVDDDPDARAMIAEYLKHLGFKDVHEFEDGRTALERLQANSANIGLIVSDWEMPQMNGLEFLKACKSNQQLAEIPFLMVTSQSSMERMKVMQAAKENVDQYLLKPFTGTEMKKRIDSLLEKARSKKIIQSLMTEAAGHMEHGRFKTAQGAFEQILRLDPEDDGALRGMGDVSIKLSGVEASLPYYKRAVEANPLNVKGYVKLAAAYEHVALVDKAIALLQNGVKQVSFSADLHFHLGRLYNRKGMSLAARAEFEKTLAIQLDHQEARLMLEMLKRGE